MARKHGDVPAGWTWRDGRPRWIPSPTLRDAGWKGQDLKDERGAWLSRGGSIDAAETIGKAVAGWRAGQLVPPAMASFAPIGATDVAGGPPKPPPARSIGALMDAYLASPEFTADLKPSTQTEYRSKLKRLVDTLAGYATLPAKDAPPAEWADYKTSVSAWREASVVQLLTPEDDDEEPVLKAAYKLLLRKVGVHMAGGVMRTASAWLEWCRDERRVIRSNPAKDVKRRRGAGRLKPASWEVLRALIAAAERLGYPSIADSIILGVDLSWSQSDRLALTWPQMIDGRVRTRRLKTNRPGETALLQNLGLPRVDQIRARQEAALGPGVTYTHVLICETTKAPWKASHYRHTFAEVRLEAAKECPSALEQMDKDWRSTAVCVAYDAGLSRIQIAGRTLHGLEDINEILDNHYGVISREVGDQGAALLNAHMVAKGIAL